MKNIILIAIIAFLFSCKNNIKEEGAVCNLNLELNSGAYKDSASWLLKLEKLVDGRYEKEMIDINTEDGSLVTLPLSLGDVNMATLFFSYNKGDESWQNYTSIFIENEKQLSLSFLAENRAIKADGDILKNKNYKALNSFNYEINEMLRKDFGKHSIPAESYINFTNKFLEENTRISKNLKQYIKLKGYTKSLLKKSDLINSDLFVGDYYDMYGSGLTLFDNSSVRFMQQYTHGLGSSQYVESIDDLENKVIFLKNNKELNGALQQELIYSSLNSFKSSYSFTKENFNLDFKKFGAIANNLNDEKQRSEVIQSFHKISLTGVGANFPEIELTNTEGAIFDSKNLFSSGKYVYIDIWASWCKPCIKEIPYLKKLEKQYANKNIKFVSISVDAKPKNWHKALKTHNLHHNQFLDKSGNITKSLNIIGIPRFLLYNPEGKLVSINAPRPSNKGQIEKLFDEYLK